MTLPQSKSSITCSSKKKASSDRINDEYTINNWPVSSPNEIHLHSIKDNYDVQQLPAYDVRNNLIHPSHYEEKLAGCTARVCFSIMHYLIKQKHVFNAIVKDITVVRPPMSIAPTTLKNILHQKKKKLMSSLFHSVSFFF